ncbi:putative transcription factor GRAS family [Helianthus annuus]|uniref:Putative transcription factor GRAS n=4 Tax=Helianthus TaxID=4231 RepID=A0A251TA58_HELAN|nr:chitin-inducible gibberellin-responsive protein 1 isoform X1 [Helianthus annuus]KAF5781065.1 putative transcription factor GRAS family [Helianthus annuus]KAJ0508342.1 putative transcription factor GRAS family [Helianthus annuus]KAJ0516615.1 putative transcription factor GRAS family [Helianthus annuus]KAJ0684618.1 putative transcription factor GRAS family [Helianthus annuus]KAJ0874244.1 putative transcription factor GRAS family [Helianthus annuus]
MGSEQFYAYRFTGQPSTYSSPNKKLPVASTLIEKFEVRNSPNCPFSNPFDSETLSSGASPSSFEVCTSFNQSESIHCMKNALQDIETTLMASDEGPSGHTKWPQQWTHEPAGSNMVQPQAVYGPRYGLSGNNDSNINLKQLLIACASALAGNKIHEFENLVERARALVSITGDPIQRLGAYMVEGLVARRELSGSYIYQALKCREPVGEDLLSYMHILYEVCPYLKFGYMAANGAIAEACRSEDRIHIIDFQIGQGTQWMTLLQALAARPGGPPHVRITGIDDPVSKYARGDSLDLVGNRLEFLSEKFKIPIEFHSLPVYAPFVTKEMLDVRPDEALAVNFPFQLHHMPDESVDVNNPRDELLRMVKSLSPKVVTLIEQESNTNTAAFFPRFLEALDFYSAIFESLDATLARDRKDRINVEQHCLARDIVNVIACEGKERVERHELFRKWRSRLTMAGFKQSPLSGYVNSVIGNLLKCYSGHYTLVEKDGALLMGWKDRDLMSASAWH